MRVALTKEEKTYLFMTLGAILSGNSGLPRPVRRNLLRLANKVRPVGEDPSVFLKPKDIFILTTFLDRGIQSLVAELDNLDKNPPTDPEAGTRAQQLKEHQVRGLDLLGKLQKRMAA